MSQANRILRVLGFVFGGIGVAMLVVALIVGLREATATDGMLPTVGEVVALQHNNPVIRFQTSAKQSTTIVGRVQSSPPAYRIGEKVSLFYDPRDPRRAVIDTYLERWFITSLFAGFAVLFTSLGVVFAIISRLGQRRVAWLRQHGVKVSGRVVDVAYNRFVKLNHRPTWQIIAEWTYNGCSGRARSFHMLDDPRPLLGNRTQIDVWIDPNNPKRAWVDTDFLDPRNAVAPAAGPVQRL